MGIFNELGEGRYNRALQKLFQIKGKPPVRQVSGEIMPTVSMFYGIENRFLEGWNRYGQFINIATVAANTGALRFRNPASSNLVAVIERLVMSDQTANIFQLAIGQTIFDLTSGTSAGVRLDGRIGSPTTFSSPMVLSFQSNAGPVGALMVQFGKVQIQVGLDYQYILHEDQEITILPGEALDIREQNTPGAEILQANFTWRERPLTESERQ